MCRLIDYNIIKFIAIKQTDNMDTVHFMYFFIWLKHTKKTNSIRGTVKINLRKVRVQLVWTAITQLLLLSLCTQPLSNKK